MAPNRCLLAALGLGITAAVLFVRQKQWWQPPIWTRLAVDLLLLAVLGLCAPLERRTV
jgi:hypothetical protein